MQGASTDLTVVVAPREKYSRARAAFEALVGADDPPFHLVWVEEARAPRRHRRWIAEHADRPDVTYLPLGHQAGANECRMRGFEASTTPYVLFLDNDAFLDRGALHALADCMRATDASFVTPLIVDVHRAVHHAGGELAIVDDGDGRRMLEELRPYHRRPVVEARATLTRSRTDCLEMHAVLVHADALRDAGGFDTELQSSLDCADLGLRLQGHHGSGWLEPDAVAMYDASAPHPSDLPLFLGRWCRATVEHDVARFAASWQIDLHDPRLEHHREQLRMRRMRVIRYVRGGLHRTFGTSPRRIDDAAEPVLDALAKVRLPT